MRKFSVPLLTAVAVLTTILPSSGSFVASAQQQVSEGERLALYSKPSVVRIIDGISGVFTFSTTRGSQNYPINYVFLGSGSFINGDGYIATNAHVVDTTQQGEEKEKELLIGQYFSTIARGLGHNLSAVEANFVRQHSSLDNVKLYHHVIIPDGSIFPFEIKAFGAPTGQGKDVAIIKIEVKNAPVVNLGDSDKLQLQDHMTVVGYPGAADTFNTGILDSKSALEASVTDGKLSAKKSTAAGAPILQISAPATHGNSGGPVLTDKDEVIGLLTFGGDRVNGQEISGFVFVVPSNTVMEFVKQAGVTNKTGPVDAAYREGLDLYWQGYYSSAITKFEEVKRLFPQHSEIDQLIRQSQQAISEGKGRSSVPMWLIVTLVALVLLFFLLVIAAVGIFMVIRSRKKKQLGAQAPREIPAQAAPSASPADAWGPPPVVESYAPVPPPIESYAPPPPPIEHYASSPPIEPYTPAPPMESYAPAPPVAPYPPPPSPSSASPDRAMAAPASSPSPSPWSPDKSTAFDFGGATMAISNNGDTMALSLGSIKFVSGPLSGQEFPIRVEGSYIGRDGTLSQIVIPDPRISKQHMWIGVRDGHVMIADKGSKNGTFLNDPRGQRVTEATLRAGDTIILGEADVVRFEYKV
jgi:serine protease Do